MLRSLMHFSVCPFYLHVAARMVIFCLIKERNIVSSNITFHIGSGQMDIHINIKESLDSLFQDVVLDTQDKHMDMEKAV
jgi:hypothetical protein